MSVETQEPYQANLGSRGTSKHSVSRALGDAGMEVKNIEQMTGASGLGTFSHTFLSPELKQLRKEYYTIITRVICLTVLIMWVCLPAYWGALATSTDMTRNLDAWFIDRDGSRIGHALWDVFGNFSAPGAHLGWTFIDPVNIGTNDDVAQAIVAEKAWIAVVVQANATSNLAMARANGDITYDPTSAITVYYAQARNEIAAANAIVPITTNLLQQTTSAYATYAAQRYLAQIRPGGTINATAFSLLANAPQTLTPAVSWKMVNLRPYTAPVATAVTLVGQIFISIFAFMTAMANATARSLVQRHLRFSSYLKLRIVIPLVIYFPLSLSYALVNLAFNLPFGARYNYASGFCLFWVYVYLAMASLGLALESMITLLTPRFVPFFLFTLIVFNVSPAVLPNDLQNSFYSYGYGFPVWNLSQAVRTIIFNTHSHLGVNASVLVGWIILSCGTISVFTWFLRRQEKAAVCNRLDAPKP